MTEVPSPRDASEGHHCNRPSVRRLLLGWGCVALGVLVVLVVLSASAVLHILSPIGLVAVVVVALGVLVGFKLLARG